MINITAKKSYGDKVVLDVSDLHFEEGKRYAIIGANGSGKSTLLKVIDGQLTSKGEMECEKGLKIAYMPQNSYAFSMSVMNNIMLSVPLKKKKELFSEAEELIRVLELEGLKKKNATKLSGGETQRVALARTLMADYDVLLLDEPTSAMDVEQAKVVIELLREKTAGATLIFSTHSMRQAEALADEVIFMYKGKVQERGSPREVLRFPSTEEAKAFINFNV